MTTAKMDLLMKKLEESTNMETAKIMDSHMTFGFVVMLVIREIIVSKQGEKPASSTMATPTGSATTTIVIKGGTRGPTSVQQSKWRQLF
jgi:cytochrome b561